MHSYKYIKVISFFIFLIFTLVLYIFMNIFLQNSITNIFIILLVFTMFVWYIATKLTINLLKTRDSSKIKLEKINSHLDDKIKEKTQKIQSLLDVFDKNVIASRTDLKGIITYASSAYQKISGYSSEELIGHSHNIGRDKDVSKEIYEDMWSTITQEKIWEGELRNISKDGTYYWLKATIEPYYEDGILVGYSSIRENITSKKELEELNNTLELKVEQRTKEIKNQLYFDNLTKLGSYQALVRDIENNNFIFTAVILLNIDNFQNINSLYGFEVGNDILKEFASCLEEFNKKNNYTLYRIYGDEFVISKNCQYSSIDDYYNDLLNVKELIQNHKFYIKDIDDSIQIDITMGISLGQENPISSVDMALRYAKKHKVWFKAFDSTLDLKNKLRETIIWKDKIKNALNENKILPVYQPIVNRDEEIIKYEVLMRMEDDDKLIAPNNFLEESINLKQYNNLAKVIFEKAFNRMIDSDKLFSINLSYTDIFNYTLINFIEENIQKSPQIASRLVIEILETQEIENYDLMNEFIAKFKEYGVRIAIDDFGTGHSNFLHIVNMDPDYIKIDGAFIKNINENTQSLSMVKSIIAFAKELDIKVIAEYVHSKEVFDTLYKLGIDEFQGYYFSEPKKDI